MTSEASGGSAAASAGGGGLDGFFRLTERGTSVGTEIRAGLTTFMVMSYIIFVNPDIISRQVAEAGAEAPPFLAVAVGTALAAGILTLAMGLVANYPFALAAGLGLNAVVAFELIVGRGFSWQEAMAVIIWEGLVILVLVLTGLRQAIMDAIPANLKRAIAVGIGLFILFIGLVNGGFVAAGAGTPVTYAGIANVATLTFVLGLAIATALLALRVTGALLISILATTVIAIALNAWVGAANSGFLANTAVLPESYFFDFSADNFATLFQPIGAMFDIFTKDGVPIIITLLVIFSLMLSDFFDTMGTVIGVGEQGGLVDRDGRLPGIGRVLTIDSLGAVLGGAFGVSSNTTYIESAAGVGEGGRTGLTSVVVGLLFLLAILIAPIAGIVPSQATAPALVVVGFLMFMTARDLEWGEIDEMFPVLVTAIVMPLTFTITTGIAAGFVTYVFLKVVRGRLGEIHPLLWVVAIAFLLFFAAPWLQGVLA